MFRFPNELAERISLRRLQFAEIESQQQSCHQEVLGKVVQRTFRASRAPGFAMEALAAHNSVVTSCNFQLPTDTRARTASARIELRQPHRRQRLCAVRLRCS